VVCMNHLLVLNGHGLSNITFVGFSKLKMKRRMKHNYSTYSIETKIYFFGIFNR
jgi:hypothetical protein